MTNSSEAHGEPQTHARASAEDPESLHPPTGSAADFPIASEQGTGASIWSSREAAMPQLCWMAGPASTDKVRRPGYQLPCTAAVLSRSSGPSEPGHLGYCAIFQETDRSE